MAGRPLTLMSRWRRWLLLGAALVSGAGVSAAVWGWRWINSVCGPERVCVDLTPALQFAPDLPTIVEDASGQEIARFGLAFRKVVPLAAMPSAVPRAFLAIEDARFYQHGGVDWQRVFGALRANLKAGGVSQGSSTITMQLARNLWPDFLPASQRTVDRKVREALVAFQLEDALSKDKILEEYLNTIYLGAGSYGVSAAAEAYFGLPLDSLNLHEIALLASLPKAPAALDPRRNPERAGLRSRAVLNRMVSLGWLSAEEASSALANPWRLVAARPAMGPQIHAVAAAGFVEVVRRQSQEILGDRLYNEGYRIRTTVVLPLQVLAESLASLRTSQIQQQRAAARWDTTVTPQAAIILGRHADGAVLAHVGGVGGDDMGFDRVTQARRQVGSTFKPIVFAAALKVGFHRDTRLSDAPVTIMLEDSTEWSPSNFDGDDEGGVVSMGDAFKLSMNRPTVRLAQLVGSPSVLEMADALGWRGETLRGFPAEWLGAASSTPRDLASIYGAFGRADGLPVAWHWIESITDRRGKVVWRPDSPTLDALGVPPEVHGDIHDLLVDVVQSGSGARARTEGGFRGLMAGKTGTTSEMRDVWFAGYTPTLVGVAWFGMDQPERLAPGSHIAGGRVAAPVVGALFAAATPQSDSVSPAAWPAWFRRERPSIDTITVSMEEAEIMLHPPASPTAWCVRERAPADTGAVVALLVPCERTP